MHVDRIGGYAQLYSTLRMGKYVQWWMLLQNLRYSVRQQLLKMVCAHVGWAAQASYDWLVFVC